MKYLPLILVLLTGCTGPGVRTALEVMRELAPLAVEALKSSGQDLDQAEAACFPVPEHIAPEDDAVYAVCRAPVK